MSKPIKFARTFPAYHPKAIEKTLFVEKILYSLPEFRDYSMHLFSGDSSYLKILFRLNPEKPKELIRKFWRSLDGAWFLEYPDDQDIIGKFHTIRSGNRWKAGDIFSPRVWSGKPYRSPQIQFAPDMEVKKVWSFEIKPTPDSINAFKPVGIYVNNRLINSEAEKVAANDGLAYSDFLSWFQYPKPFCGQIISWSNTIEY